MSIHVKELVIKANVGTDAGAPMETADTGANADMTAAIKAAVAETMRMLKDKKHR